MTKEHKENISKALKGKSRRKLFFRMYFEDGQFNYDIITDTERPEGFLPLTVKTVELAKAEIRRHTYL